MITEDKVQQQFYEYLSDTFGPQFTEMIKPPEGVRIGERVLYKLQNQHEAQRKEVTQKDLDNFHQMMVGIAEGCGGIASPPEPPVTSGLPFPRTVDITDWSDVALGTPAMKYVVSDELLPKVDFSIEWLFGLVFSSEKQLVYIDFTDPKVKSVFSVTYDSDFDSSVIGFPVRQELLQFKERRNEMIREVESNPNNLWAKLVQLDNSVITHYKRTNTPARH